MKNIHRLCEKKKGWRCCRLLTNVLSNIRRCDVPGWKVILMIVSHMFLLLPLQERQSCRGELTTRSSFSLGKLNPFDVRLHVSICDSYRTPMIFICIPVRTFFDFSSFIFFLARFCFVWFLFIFLIRTRTCMIWTEEMWKLIKWKERETFGGNELIVIGWDFLLYAMKFCKGDLQLRYYQSCRDKKKKRKIVFVF